MLVQAHQLAKCRGQYEDAIALATSQQCKLGLSSISGVMVMCRCQRTTRCLCDPELPSSLLLHRTSCRRRRHYFDLLTRRNITLMHT